MTTRPRPLSPHLQVYRLPLLAVLSITHRITGVGLVAGLVVLAWWLCAAAQGPAAFNAAQDLLGSPIGLLALFGWTVALFFHLAHGVRHLLWDAGWGYALPKAYVSGKAAIVVTAAMTLIVWIAALA